ncbi:hypothetical protein RCL1_000713 [Eukaryota sp. TZLM3-RCL]
MLELLLNWCSSLPDHELTFTTLNPIPDNIDALIRCCYATCSPPKPLTSASTSPISASQFFSWLHSYRPSIEDCPLPSEFLISSSSTPYIHNENSFSMFMYRHFCHFHASTSSSTNVLAFFDSLSRPFGTVVARPSDLVASNGLAFLCFVRSYFWNLLPLKPAAIQSPILTCLSILSWANILPENFENLNVELFTSPRCALILATIIHANILKLNISPLTCQSLFIASSIGNSVYCDLMVNDFLSCQEISNEIESFSDFCNLLKAKSQQVISDNSVLISENQSFLISQLSRDFPFLDSSFYSNFDDLKSDLSVLSDKLDVILTKSKTLFDVVTRVKLAFSMMKKPLPEKISLFSLDSVITHLKNSIIDICHATLIFEIVEILGHSVKFLGETFDTIVEDTLPPAKEVLAQFKELESVFCRS